MLRFNDSHDDTDDNHHAALINAIHEGLTTPLGAGPQWPTPMVSRREQRLEHARQCARDVLLRFGLLATENIAAVATRLGVTVMRGKVGGGDARLIYPAGAPTILVSHRLHPAVRRFRIAHGLGHFVLGHPVQYPSRIRKNLHRPLVEQEANAFAAELLMPAALVRDRCDLSRPSLDVVREIRAHFNVSLLSAAIRFTELSRAPCAAVFSISARSGAGKVDWVAWSGALDPGIRRSGLLSPSSLASSFFTSYECATEPKEVPWAAWFSRAPAGRVVEQVDWALGRGSTLSMIWIDRSEEPPSSAEICSERGTSGS